MIEVLLYVLGVVILLVGLAVSIALHEIGHLLPAKLFGVKVTQYMIGFGKTIWSRRKGETEYGVKLLPFGGYVAMTGMYPPQQPGDEARASTTGFLNSVVQEGAAVTRRGDPSTATATAAGSHDADRDAVATDERASTGIAGLVDEARLASAETIAAGEDHRTYYRLPVWKKIIIMFGGPFMNLVLAFVFFAIALSGFGVAQSTTTLAEVSECLQAAGSTATTCGADDEAAPAAAAGLLPGDRIVAVDDAAITDWNQFRDLVSASPDQTLDVTIERDGSQTHLELTPVPNERLLTDDNGAVVTDSSGAQLTETVGMIGATPASETKPLPLSEVPSYVGDNIANVAGVIVHLPERMIGVWNAAFGSEERDPNGPMGVVGVGRLAGEVASLDQAPVAARAQVMVQLLGSLNIALFVFNLVPLMPLDGGHIAGALYEGVKRGIAKLRGKPDPGPVDTAKMVPVTFVVVIVLGAMSLLLAYADIVKPVSLFG